jgi:hypothetical protein
LAAAAAKAVTLLAQVELAVLAAAAGSLVLAALELQDKEILVAMDKALLDMAVAVAAEQAAQAVMG